MARTPFFRRRKQSTTDGQERVEDLSLPEQDVSEVPTSDDGETVDSANLGEAKKVSLAEFMEQITKWRADLVTAVKKEAEETIRPGVDLTGAHPGGMAALYADSEVLLSNLVREEGAFQQAWDQMQEVLDRAKLLQDVHGVADVHLIVGTASWEGDTPARDVPVLIRRINVEQRQGDVALRLLPGADVSSRLIEQLSSQGAGFDASGIEDALRGESGYSPGTALDLLREAGRDVPGFRLKNDVSIAVNSHPASKLYKAYGDIDSFAQTTILGALAGDGPTATLISEQGVVQDPADRDPSREFGVGDQTPAVLDAVDTVLQGTSVLVDVEDQQEQPRVIESLAVALAQAGKRVLVVVGNPQLRSRVEKVFDDDGLAGVYGSFWGDHSSDIVVAQKLREAATNTAPSGGAEERAHLRAQLRQGREALLAYSVALHEVFPRWGVSPFDALQTLTDLTSNQDPPRTQVRFDGDTLTRVAADGAERTVALLEQADSLGIFAPRAATVWDGLLVEDQDQVDLVLRVAGNLADETLPAARMQMSTAAGETGLVQAENLAQWQDQLELFVRARDVLDRFRPEVFEQSLTDLVVATAPAEWRKQKGISLPRSARRHALRQAKDLVRPGVHIPDLHEALAQAQSCRYDWRQVAGDEVWPSSPEQLEAFQDTYAQLEADLAQLQPYFSQASGDLSSLSLDQLSELLASVLRQGDEGRKLPKRLQTHRELLEFGLQDFVVDMATRSVSGEGLILELELAWWASALAMMLESEPRLGGFDPDYLQDVLLQTRNLDAAHVDSLAWESLDRIQANRRQALTMHEGEYGPLLGDLDAGRETAPLFGHYDLAGKLLPISVTGTALVPDLVPEGQRVDAVVLAGLEKTPFGALPPILAHAEQVVVVSGAQQDVESAWDTPFRELLPRVVVPPAPQTVNSQLQAALATYFGGEKKQVIPTPRPMGEISLVYVEGTGTPAPGEVGVESSSQEVQVVVDLLLDALAKEPNSPVVVATLSRRHASRIVSTLRRLAAGDSQIRDALRRAGGIDDLVVDARQLTPARSRKVILSVGYAKTAHGRLIHDFGDLSTEEGIEAFRSLVESVSSDLVVVTSLRSNELDRDRLRFAGENALADLLAAAELEGQQPVLPQWPTTDERPDDLLIDLAERLHGLGLEVVPNVGTEDGFRIPLAIGHPEVPGELLVAVLTDDQQYLREPSLRVRDRHRVRYLEEQGWKVRTVLSMAVFIDPNREARKIVDLVLDAVDEYYERMGLPLTPAAAAALGQGAPVEQDFGESAQFDAEAELDVATGEIPVVEQPLFDLAADVVGLGYADEEQVGQSVPVDVAPPDLVRGLPLTAYSDAQLDALSGWLYAQDPSASIDDQVEALRSELGLKRRGAKSDTILRTVAKRTAPGGADSVEG